MSATKISLVTDQLFNCALPAKALPNGTRFPNALGKVIKAGADDFEAKSLTIKRTEKRADLFLISRKTKRMILVEPQGYKDARLIPLYPLYDVTPTEIKQRAFDWAEQIRATSDLRKQEKELDRIAAALLTTRNLSELKKAF